MTGLKSLFADAKKMIEYFLDFNEVVRLEAIKRIAELTQLEQYTRKGDPDNGSTYED